MSDIKKYTIKNDRLKLTVLNIGASIYELQYKNVNCVLSYENIEQYVENPICLGAMVGRVAGRISNAKFELNGKIYQLDNNENDYSIHGGYINLTKKYWDLVEISEKDVNPYIILKTKLNDGDSGYPGNVDIKVKYIIVNATLRIEIFAVSDKDTIVNITNHAYFNLNADKTKSIKNHELRINSDKFLAAADNCVPISIEDAKNTDFDLLTPKSLSILDNLTHVQTLKFGGYDHTFILNGNLPYVTLKNKSQNISMEVYTSYPSVVVYSGNAIGNNINMIGSKSFNHQGICFEAQYEPDFINKDFLPNYILRKDEEFMNVIEFKFN